MTDIDLKAASDYRRSNYGVLLESTTQHSVVGRGVHNRHHPHRLDVWANKADIVEGKPCFIDPRNRPTEQPYSFLLSAQAVVISARRIGDEVEEGPDLAIGEVVRVTVHGLSLGWFQIRAQQLRDPILEPVDISTSASRQHYIDTGEYLERDLEI